MNQLIKYCKSDSYQLLKQNLRSKHVNQSDIWGRRLIYYAIISGAYRCVEILIDTGNLDLSLENKVPRVQHYERPIVTCIKYDQIQIFRSLAGLTRYQSGSSEFSQYLHTILKSGSNDFLLAYLQEYQIISLKNQEMLLCSHAKVEHYQILFDNQICFNLLQALKYTLTYRKYTQFNYLLDRVKYSEQLEHTYYNNILTKKYYRAEDRLVGMVVVQGYLRGLKTLQEKGADLSAYIVNQYGESVNYVMYLCSNRNYYTEKVSRQQQILSSLEYLLNSGISVDLQNNLGMTALMFACRAGNSDYVRVLLQYGANKDLLDNNNQTAIDYLNTAKLGFGQLNTDHQQIIRDLLS